jgi:hypothetical protein
VAIDYSRFQSGANPLQMAMQGFSDAGAIQQAQQQRAIGQQNYELNQMKVAEYQKAQAKKQQFQSAVAQLNEKEKPSAQDYQQLIANFPELGRIYDDTLSAMNEQQKQATITRATTAYSLLSAGNIDLAKTKIKEYADAAENVGDTAMADAFNVINDQIDINPNAARDTAGMLLARTQGEKFGSTLESIHNMQRENELQPMLLEKATSEAATAAVNARFAESLAAAEASSKGFDISSLIIDPAIAKQNKRVANLINLRDQATSDLSIRKLESDLNNAQIARDAATLEKVSEIETAQLNVDTMMLTIADLETLGEQKITTFGIPFQNVREAATGTLEGSDAWYNATWNQPVADYQETINTLKSQVFLTQIPKMKGFGALSGSEGARLETAIKSLSLRQSSERLKENLATIKELTSKAQEFLVNKYGNLSVNAAAARKRAEGGMGVTVPGDTSGFRIVNRRPRTE